MYVRTYMYVVVGVRGFAFKVVSIQLYFSVRTYVLCAFSASAFVRTYVLQGDLLVFLTLLTGTAPQCPTPDAKVGVNGTALQCNNGTATCSNGVSCYSNHPACTVLSTICI